MRSSSASLLAFAALGACVPQASPPQAAVPAPATVPAPPPPVIMPPPPALPTAPPATMQYLYGSGEAAALSIAAYRSLTDFAQTQVTKRPADSVVLAEGSTLDAPRFEACGDKPLAAVFDVDETMILNLGEEWHEASSGRPYDGKVWDKWEKTGADKVAPVPGAVSAVNALRRMGVTVIFNTNRLAENAAQTAAAIKFAGLGDAVHKETLFLKGDDTMGSAKDGRRTTIAAKYCVIAMGGDQLGDFTDLFNQQGMGVKGRRDEVSSGWASRLWGAGWFLLPNPVYGSGLKGGFDDVFPMDRRWSVPPEETK
ncbi:MAG: acid phosphatase [Sphingobium sp.]|nr:acid phosphatase [Sphingobium sp.]